MSDLDSALDALFAVSPEAFIDQRKLLAAGLKGADAKTVLAQKKPTRVAHVLNLLSRAHPAEIEALSKIGQRLVGKQNADSLREVIGEQRKAVNDLSAKAAALGASAQELTVVNTVLYGATTSAARAAELKEGRFSKAPEAAVSFAEGLNVQVFETAPVVHRAPELKIVESPKPDLEKERRHAAAVHAAEIAEKHAAEARDRAVALSGEAKALAHEADAAEKLAIAARTKADKAHQASSSANEKADALEEKAANLRAIADGD